MLPNEIGVKYGCFSKILSLEKRFPPLQAVLGTQLEFLRIIGFIADILVTFPLAFDLFLKIPPSRKITNKFGIYTCLGGDM